MKRYEQFPHTADIGLRIYGADLKELFENAAYGMFDLVADLEGLKPTTSEKVEAAGQNYEELLVAFLDELLYNFYTKSVIYSKFKIVELSVNKVRAEVSGRPIGANRNRLKIEVKAVTYSDLKIRKTDEGFVVEIIFDV